MGLGIDFGTSYSAAAVVADGIVRLVELEYDRTVSPSLIFVTEGGEFTFGRDAELAGQAVPERLLIGLKGDIPALSDLVVGGHHLSTVSALASVLSHIRNTTRRQFASVMLSTPVTLTLPATYHDTNAEEVYREAARLAGFDLNTVAFVPEPVAAAISYLAGSAPRLPFEPGAVLLVYDLGGGTFDAAAVECGTRHPSIVGIPTGDADIGGNRFDRVILNAALDRAPAEVRDLYLRPAPGPEMGQWRGRMTHALRVCREAKEGLAWLDEVPLALPGFAAPPTVSARALDALIEPLIQVTASHLQRLADETRQMGRRPAAILLVGGSCRLRVVRQVLESSFDLPLLSAPDPARIVAIGAAIEAAGRVRKPDRIERSRAPGARDNPAEAYGRA